MIEKEDHKSILMIGGIKVFLPYSPVEASMCCCQCSNSGRTASCDYQRDGADVISCQGEEEENTIKMLTPWEKDI
jgi:hypothetical protein